MVYKQNINHMNLPIMTTAQRLAITSPITGTLCFDSTENSMFIMDDNGIWQKINPETIYTKRKRIIDKLLSELEK
jgi:hypothetical protein